MLSFSNFLRRALVASKSKYIVYGYDKALGSPLVPLNSCHYRSGITHNTEIRAYRGQNVSLCFGWLESLEALDNGSPPLLSISKDRHSKGYAKIWFINGVDKCKLATVQRLKS